jgi:hypothetical protein
MATDPDDGSDEARQEREEPPLVLQLTLTEDDPLSGSVGVAGGSVPRSFRGWIDLMSAIKDLRKPTDTTDAIDGPR